MATGRSPGTLWSNGTASLSQTSPNGSRRRWPRVAFFAKAELDRLAVLVERQVVTVAGQPAFRASAGELNQRPK
jgi:hypothetical protein